MASKKAISLDEMASRLVTGDRRMAARLITMAENRSEKIGALMKLINPHIGGAKIIGLTGSGGSGKSTLIDRLIGAFRGLDMTVGVVANLILNKEATDMTGGRTYWYWFYGALATYAIGAIWAIVTLFNHWRATVSTLSDNE